MVTKRTIGAAVGVVILVLYLCVALTWARSQAREQICMGLDGDRVHVADDRQLRIRHFRRDDQRAGVVGTAYEGDENNRYRSGFSGTLSQRSR